MIGPGPKLEIHRAVAVTDEEASRGRLLQHVRLPERHRLEQLNCFPGIDAVVEAYGQIDPPQPVAKSPICHLFRNQLGVGNDDICSLPGTHSAGADADPARGGHGGGVAGIRRGRPLVWGALESVHQPAAALGESRSEEALPAAAAERGSCRLPGHERGRLGLGRYPNLVSRFMKLMLARLSSDWEDTWGHPVALAESFVDPSSIVAPLPVQPVSELGLTSGWKRSAVDFYEKHDHPKQVWVRELVKKACVKLRAPQLPPPWAEVLPKVSPRCTAKAGEIASLMERRAATSPSSAQAVPGLSDRKGI